MSEIDLLSHYIKEWLKDDDGRSFKDLENASGVPYTTGRAAALGLREVSPILALKLLLVVTPLENVMSYFEKFTPELNEYSMLVAAKHSKSLSSIEPLDRNDCAILSWMICLESESETNLLGYFGSSARETISKLVRLNLLIKNGEFIETPAAKLHLSDPIVRDLTRYFQEKINLEIALHSNWALIGSYSKENANRLYLKAKEQRAELLAMADSMREEKGEYKLAISSSTICL